MGEGAFAGAVWLTPGWQPFTFHESKTVSGGVYENVPQGAIPAITYQGKRYEPVFNGQVFEAFKYQNEVLPINIVSLSPDSEVKLYRNTGVCGRNSYYSAKWKDVQGKKGVLDFGDGLVEFGGIVPCSQSVWQDDSECSQFVYIHPGATPNNSLLRNYQKSTDLALERALNGISGNMGAEVRQQGVFHHIQMANTTASVLGDNQMELLEDKLHLLAYHTGIKMVVSFLHISNNTSLYDFQISDMAQRSMEKHNTAGSKLLYVILPFSDYESIFGVGLFNNKSCFNSGFAQSHDGILNNLPQAYEGSTVYERIINIYRQIEKPLFIHRFYIKADRSVVEVKLTSDHGFERGHPDINRVEVFQSKYYEYINSRIATIRNLPNTIDRDDQINVLSNQVVASLVEADAAEFDFSVGSGQNVWQLQADESPHAFREVYMSNEGVVRAHFKLRSTSSLGQSLQIYNNFNQTLGSEHYYKFDINDGLAPYVYGVSDFLSLIPIPFVSSIGDGLGYCYSTYRGDMAESGFYAAGLAMAFGSAWFKFGGSSMDDLFTIVARQKPDEGIELISKQVKQLGPDDLPVCPAISASIAEADAFRLHLSNSDEAMENIRKFVKQTKGGRELD